MAPLWATELGSLLTGVSSVSAASDDVIKAIDEMAVSLTGSVCAIINPGTKETFYKFAAIRRL